MGHIYSIREALIMLWAWHHCYKIRDKIIKNITVQSGKPVNKKKIKFGELALKKGFETAETSLHKEPDHSADRLLKVKKCLSCGADMLGSGIPGRILSYEDFIFVCLCGHCISSMGKKDFLEWWIDSGKKVEELHIDAFCIYLRLRYCNLEKNNKLDEPAPKYYLKAIDQVKESFQPDIRARYMNHFPIPQQCLKSYE